MKTNLLLSLLTVMLSVSGCRVNIGDNAEIIDPSENIVRAKYPLKAFDKVENHVVGNIQLVQSAKSRVTLSAPDNYIDFFEFKDEDGKLKIEYAKDKNLNISAEHINIIIYTPTLQEIDNAGAANICLDSLTTDEFEIKNSGVGEFDLAKVMVRKIDVSNRGVGSIRLSGQADEAEYSCSGVGSIHAKEMKARETKAKVSGVGSIDCYASESIEGQVSGVGGLNYAGHPAKKDLHHSMTGGIKEL